MGVKTMQNSSYFFPTLIFLLANKSHEKFIYSLSKPVAPDPGEADSRSLPLYSVCSPRPSMLAFLPSPFPKNFPGRNRVLNTFKVRFPRTRPPTRFTTPKQHRTFPALSPGFFQSSVTNVTSREDTSQQSPLKKKKIACHLSLHSKMAPKSKNFLNFIVSFLQRFLGFSCEAASPGLRASKQASKQKRERGRGWGWGGRTQTETELGRVGSRARTWETARARGAGGPGTEPRGSGAGSRGGGAEGALSRWLRRSSESGVAEAERSECRSCARPGGERGAGGEPPAAALEKAGSGGVATRCSRSPPFPPPALGPSRALLPGPGAEGGRG